jgi:thiamine kinase-like enzyme
MALLTSSPGAIFPLKKSVSIENDDQRLSFSGHGSRPRAGSFSTYFEQPECKANYTIDCEEETVKLHATICTLVSELCPLMKDITAKQMTVSTLGGGLTNKLFVVEGRSPEIEDDTGDENGKTSIVKVLVRVNGKAEEDILIDREIENRKASLLSAAGIAPKFFGRFMNGRVEEFFENTTTLTFDQLMQEGYSASVAKAMAELHLIAVDDGIIDTNKNEDGQIHLQMNKWLKLANDLTKNDEDGKCTQLLTWASASWAILEKEIQRDADAFVVETQDAAAIETMLADHSSDEELAIAFSRTIVFTHMDMQSLNILISDAWKPFEIRLIDFEYAGHNARSTDIGNTFNECVDMNNLVANFEKSYPSDEQQKFFLSKYLDTHAPALKEALEKNTRRYEGFLNAWCKDIHYHALASHLLWAVWAIVQSKVSPIEYDYLAYGLVRKDGYEYTRKLLL